MGRAPKGSVFRFRCSLEQRSEIERRAQAAGFADASKWALATLLADATSPDGRMFRLSDPRESNVNTEEVPMIVEITDRQIEQLQAEAARAGDLLQVAICRIALGDDAPGQVEHDAADARGWTDYTGSGMARWELARIESVRSAEDPQEYARVECEAAIARG